LAINTGYIVANKKYAHIFFDLDNTLWDFEANSIETFRDLFIKYDLENRGIVSFDKFIQVYHKHNSLLWEFYRQGKIVKEVLNIRRFSMALDEFGIGDHLLSSNMAGDYVEQSPTKTQLFPDAFAILDYLSSKYRLHIITNGFEEVQFRKLSYSGLRKYFSGIITSEEAGTKKPDPAIFNYALSFCKADVNESVMIGDDEEIDVLGAFNVGMDSILVDYAGKNNQSKATHRINSLQELYNIL
jgi:putative hydrolase of the HAD superfamily